MSNATPPMPPVPKLEETQERPHGGFWANSMVASVTGASTSIIIHAAIIIAGLLLIPDVRKIVTDLVVPEEQNIIPTAELATEQPGGIPNPGVNSDATRAAQMVDASVTQSDAFSESKNQNLSETLAQGNPSETSMPIGTGLQTSSGLSSGGKLARFGPPGGGTGIGPKDVLFFGDNVNNGGNAYKIVFICDGTGTMVGLKKELVAKELLKTVGQLKPIQEFNIVFFHEGSNASAVDANKLLPATKANKDRAFSFLNRFAAAGKTDPIPAIELAFKLKPQLIYLLSDGAFDDLTPYDQVVAAINKLNPDKKVKINTVMFYNSEEKDTASLKKAEDVLKKIASENGGRQNSVTPETFFNQQ